MKTIRFSSINNSETKLKQDERIGIINRELGTAETELADFKQRSGLTDLTSDARLAMRKIVDNYSGRTMMLNGEDYDTLALLENRSIANYQVFSR